MTSNYSPARIQVLEGLEPVRKRPGMSVGSTDSRGLHDLVYQALHSSIDEAVAGYCTHIEVALNAYLFYLKVVLKRRPYSIPLLSEEGGFCGKVICFTSRLS